MSDNNKLSIFKHFKNYLRLAHAMKDYSLYTGYATHAIFPEAVGQSVLLKQYHYIIVYVLIQI